MPRVSAKSNRPKTGTPTSHASIGAPAGGSGAAAPFRIAADGTWFHEDGVIARPEMVRLFAGALRRDPVSDGYALVTPYERHAVTVEDAPFVAVAVRSEGTGRDRRLTFVTNIDAEVAAGSDHPIVVRTGPAGDPRPYLLLGDGLEARIGRAVFYETAALAEAGPNGELGVWSGGMFFPLEIDLPIGGARP